MPFDVADLGVDVTDVAVATVGGHVQVAASSSDAEGKMYFYRLGGAEDLVSLEGDLELQVRLFLRCGVTHAWVTLDP